MREITDENYEAAVADTPTLLDFWAPTCGPCRAMEPLLEELEAEFGPRVQVGKVNVYEQPTLARAFGITSIPTLVALSAGEVLGTSVGYRGRGPLRVLFESLRSSAEQP